jgi:hypothetical protein
LRRLIGPHNRTGRRILSRTLGAGALWRISLLATARTRTLLLTTLPAACIRVVLGRPVTELPLLLLLRRLARLLLGDEASFQQLIAQRSVHDSVREVATGESRILRIALEYFIAPLTIGRGPRAKRWQASAPQ